MSLGFEQAILGTVLKFPESINDIDITIMPADFVCVSHQMIWTKIVSLNDGHQLSQIAIVEGFRHEGYLEQIGQDVGAVTGEEYFQFLLTKASAASVNHFAEQVVDASIKRSMDRDVSLTKVELTEERPADEILDVVVNGVVA